MFLPYLVFFVSGFTALAYQIVWQRVLGIFSGSDVESATIIVAAFMAGLGCGSLVGGRLADRLSSAASLACFALAELGIGVFGAFSATLYYDVLYRQLGHLSWSLEARAAMLFLNLLWPTLFMGASLPLLARAVTRDIGHAAGNSGMLYAVNTLGAAVGALMTTWWLLPTFGLQRSLQMCAMVNLAASVAVAPLALTIRRRESTEGVRSPVEIKAGEMMTRPTADGVTVTFAAWAVMYGIAGFLALSLEIVWFRVLGILLKSTAYSFGTLLAHFLAGLGVGALVGTLAINRTRRPALTFVLMQAAIGVCAGVGLLLMLWIATRVGAPQWLTSYIAANEPLDVAAAMARLNLFLRGQGEAPREFLAVYMFLPAVLIGPSTVLMGASFPMLQKTVQTDLRQLGQRVGTLLMANIGGSAVGTVVTGWFALSWLGTAGTIKALLVVSVVFPLFGLTLVSAAAFRTRLFTAAAAAGAIAVLLVSLPDGSTLWGRLHGAAPRAMVHGEDRSGLSLLKIEPGQTRSRVVVFGNGASQSWIPYGGIHTLLGALPAFMHPDPHTAVVIGLGSGDTLFAVSGRKQIERIWCLEILKPQLTTLRQLSQLQQYPALDLMLRDPRIEHRYGDGRTHIMRAGVRYDLIEADALRPATAYSGNLYSDTYFALLRDHLTPGGLAVSWSPTPRIHDTFVKAFSHVLSYGDIVIGSNQPIAFDPSVMRRRLAEPEVQEHFAAAGLDIQALLQPYLDRRPQIFSPDHDRSALDDINTDLFPKDEYGVPRERN